MIYIYIYIYIYMILKYHLRRCCRVIHLYESSRCCFERNYFNTNHFLLCWRLLRVLLAAKTPGQTGRKRHSIGGNATMDQFSSTMPLPSMALNLDACSNGVPCPVKTGRQYLNVIMDFTKVH
uniref:Secreted protein n=1 Tax=Heterorhabditis bacteriophora TaxID=37862 RepID=A0A1I7X060_HETBA